MKLIYIILSTIFVVACSDIDLNGYTDSIVKKTALEDGSKHYALYKEGDNPPTTNCEDYFQSSKEDITIKDVTCLTVNHNPFTGEIQIINPVQDFPYAWVDEKQPYKYGIDNLPNDCMPLKNTNSSANALPIQCFDTFNPEKGEDYTPTIFISAKIDENDPTKLNTNSYSSSSQNSSSSYCQGISLNLSNMLKGQTYDNYYIAHEWVYDIQSEDASKLQRVQKIKDDDITGKQQHCINISKIEDSGIHSIYGAQKSTSRSPKRTASSRPLNIKLINIKIIPYKPITKNIRYIQISGDATADNNAITADTPCSDADYQICEDSGSNIIDKYKFTRCCVKKYFDKTFAPAMVNVNVEQYPYKRMLLKIPNYNDFSEVRYSTGTVTPNVYIVPGTTGGNIPDPEGNNIHIYQKPELLKLPYYRNGFIIIDYTQLSKANDIGEHLKSTALSLDHPKTDVNDPKYRVVFAINKVQKVWKIKDCLVNQKDRSCFHSNIKDEPSDVKFYIYNDTKDEYKFPGKEVEVLYEKVTYEKEGTPKTPLKVWRLREKATKKVKSLKNFNDDDYIYTNNGYPIIPLTEVIDGPVHANATRISESYKNELKDYGELISKGGVVFVSKGAGPDGLYTLMHELGHTFGLTDVTMTDILVNKEEDDIPSDDSKNYESNPTTSKNNYATQYTNLMSWTIPSGNKIRYRPTQIACTEGRFYHSEEDKSTPIKYNLGPLEYSIPMDNKNDTEINQWECIRDCYQDKFLKGGRIDYWLTTKQSLYHTDKYQNYQRCLSEKYTNIATKELYEAKLKEQLESKKVKE